MKKIPNALIILDGYGLAPKSSGNAIELEGSKNIKEYMKNYPSSTLGASGLSVGLPDGQMGNSEVGHLNIGAGRIVYQELTRISKAITAGDFFENAALAGAINSAKTNGKKLHLMGLISDGGVHSHNTHIYALLKMAKDGGLDNAYVHAFMDGRDVSPTSGAGFIAELEGEMSRLKFGQVASVSGRYYAMDRDNRWERVESAYDTLTVGGEIAESAQGYINECYQRQVTDEFLPPVSIAPNGAPVLIEKGDSIIFFNFRPDRARQLTRAFTEHDFAGFERKSGFLSPHFVCFTQYDATFKNVFIAFSPQSLENTLGEYLSKSGKTQLRIAETEKYAHVTFFFNGGVEQPNFGEERALIPSPKVATYDLQPEMSAYLVTDRMVKELDSGKHDFFVLNFANCDMVGHTGILTAAEAAVKAVDECVKKVVDKILSLGGSAVITADHGNAEKMFDDDGSVFTAHTTNPVPVILVSEKHKAAKLKSGILADLAPTLLDIMGLQKPPQMSGGSIILR